MSDGQMHLAGLSGGSTAPPAHLAISIYGYDLPPTAKSDYHGSANLRTPAQREVAGIPRQATSPRMQEVGLDYFGARYFSGAQGRFTSPDAPLLDQHILDPQSWNLYTYARNNPLRYVDPTGEEVELIGDEEQRNKALAVLQGNVGKTAGDRLWVETVTKHGKDHYMVRIKGDSADFAKMGTAAADLSSLVGAKPTLSPKRSTPSSSKWRKMAETFPSSRK